MDEMGLAWDIGWEWDGMEWDGKGRDGVKVGRLCSDEMG